MPIASIITPPASICAAVALNTFSLRPCRFEYDDPIDQPRHAICSAITAGHETGCPPVPPRHNSGQTSSTIPRNPSTNPAAVRHVIRSPSLRNASTPAIQNGEDATTTAARPLGTDMLRPHHAAVSQHEHQEAEHQRIAASRAGRGSRSPRVAM